MEYELNCVKHRNHLEQNENIHYHVIVASNFPQQSSDKGQHQHSKLPKHQHQREAPPQLILRHDGHQHRQDGHQPDRQTHAQDHHNVNRLDSKE